ncbi:hypothetical protein [Bradyrhizobium sp. McL0615]|uniref:hypothetical protein n=1 Tax=Bradyrhizobium sp. McL0615 TaxID=3415673 RepID=UPI003CF34EA7
MNRFTPTVLEIDTGVSIGVSDAGIWSVRAGDNRFSLEETNDFFRVWLLFERPFPEVKADLERVAADAKVDASFPFAKLIGSALNAMSGHWTECAMTWVPFLTLMERAPLKSLFIEVRDSKWASQKIRQLARKYVSEIERGVQSGRH